MLWFLLSYFRSESDGYKLREGKLDWVGGRNPSLRGCEALAQGARAAVATPGALAVPRPGWAGLGQPREAVPARARGGMRCSFQPLTPYDSILAPGMEDARKGCVSVNTFCSTKKKTPGIDLLQANINIRDCEKATNEGQCSHQLMWSWHVCRIRQWICSSCSWLGAAKQDITREQLLGKATQQGQQGQQGQPRQDTSPQCHLPPGPGELRHFPPSETECRKANPAAGARQEHSFPQAALKKK